MYYLWDFTELFCFGIAVIRLVARFLMSSFVRNLFSFKRGTVGRIDNSKAMFCRVFAYLLTLSCDDHAAYELHSWSSDLFIRRASTNTCAVKSLLVVNECCATVTRSIPNS